jgi:hypothetical protein
VPIYEPNNPADPELQVRMVADWLIRAMGGKATIIELEGTSGSSSAIGRKQGFDAKIATRPGMKVVASQAADFERAKARAVAREFLTDEHYAEGQPLEPRIILPGHIIDRTNAAALMGETF